MTKETQVWTKGLGANVLCVCVCERERERKRERVQKEKVLEPWVEMIVMSWQEKEMGMKKGLKENEHLRSLTENFSTKKHVEAVVD